MYDLKYIFLEIKFPGICILSLIIIAPKMLYPPIHNSLLNSLPVFKMFVYFWSVCFIGKRHGCIWRYGLVERLHLCSMFQHNRTTRWGRNINNFLSGQYFYICNVINFLTYSTMSRTSGESCEFYCLFIILY